QRRAITRLRNLSSDAPEEDTTTLAAWLRGALPRIGSVLMPKKEDYCVADLRANLLRSGIYARNALRVFMGVKLILMLLLPIPFALLPYGLGLLSLHHGLVASLLASCLGMVLPTVWLRYQVKARQRRLRRAIPDI